MTPGARGESRSSPGYFDPRERKLPGIDVFLPTDSSLSVLAPSPGNCAHAVRSKPTDGTSRPPRAASPGRSRRIPVSLNLYLLRHGQTEASRENVFCGSSDPELTADGLAMAEAFAAAYRARPWAAVFASPMLRTVATARALCDATGITPHP